MSDETRYKNSIEAYRAIHSALGWAIDAMIDDCDYKSAIEYCDLMRDIEARINV